MKKRLNYFRKKISLIKKKVMFLNYLNYWTLVRICHWIHFENILNMMVMWVYTKLLNLYWNIFSLNFKFCLGSTRWSYPKIWHIYNYAELGTSQLSYESFNYSHSQSSWSNWISLLEMYNWISWLHLKVYNIQCIYK